MRELTLRRALVHRTKELAAWQAGAVGLLVLASLLNAAAAAALIDARDRLADQALRLQQAEQTERLAPREQSPLPSRTEQVQAELERQADPADGRAYRYIGECVVTSYCPCEACCGAWADGLTATGVPAEPGVVAVDPEVIPLGSTVILNNRAYRAADVGVKGLAVDICAAEHQEAAAYGVQRQDVWVIEP